MLFNFKKKHKYINGTRGVISIFLALLMAPFTMVAGALMDVARVYSAVSIFDEALCNASNSTLGTYDPYLKKRFGLLAIKQSNSSTPTEEGVQEFINGIFNDYMQVNCGSLPGAYNKDNIQTKAAGVYPLSDLSIMKTQVLEYSKYNIPAKFAADAISLDDIVGSIEKLIPGYEIFDMLTKGFETVDTAIGVGETLSSLYTAEATQKDCKDNYNTAHTKFEESITKYNEANEEYEEAKEALDDAIAALSGADEEDKEALQSAYDSAKAAADDAKEALDSAKSEVLDAKSVYISQIEGLIGSVKDVQEEKDNLKSSFDDFVDGSISCVVEANKLYKDEIIKDNKEIVDDRNKKIGERNDNISALKTEMDSLNETEKKVWENDDISDEQKQQITIEFDEQIGNSTEKVNGYNNEIKAMEKEVDTLNKMSADIENDYTLVKGAVDAGTKAKDALNEYDKVVTDAGYSAKIEELETLLNNVSSFDIESGSESSPEGTLYVDVEMLLTNKDITTFEESICSQAAGKTGLKMISIIIGFWKEIANIGLEYSPVLTAVIDESHYSRMGGLPSRRSGYYNPYGDSDREMSERYKEAMGKFSSSDNAYSGSLIDDIILLVQNIKDLMNTIGDGTTSHKRILQLVEWLKSIADSAKTVIAQFKRVCANFTFSNLVQSLLKKSLCAGYIYYNIPCRTTYQDFVGYEGLTSATSVTATVSRSFCGAEAEYILCGGLLETSNQSDVFWMLYIIRLVLNIVPLATNAELNTVINGIRAIPFIGVIAATVIQIFYFFVEPLLDTVILCGGGKVPLYKNYVYMTAGGIDHFVDAICNMDILQDKKDKIDSLANDIRDGGNKAPKSGFLELDYHTYLFILITLFVNESDTYKRLADIVQMEGSQSAYESGGGEFCLAYSYTYLRASGSFDARLFMPISGKSLLSADQRVIYQGY